MGPPSSAGGEGATLQRILRVHASFVSGVDLDICNSDKTYRSPIGTGFKAHVAVEPETGLDTRCNLTLGLSEPRLPRNLGLPQIPRPTASKRDCRGGCCITPSLGSY